MSENTPADNTPALRSRRRRNIPSGVVMVGMAVVVWWPCFTLGAYGEIFFDQLLAMWAASTAAFVFVLVERRPVGARLWRAFLLLIPSLWLVLMFVVGDETDDIFVFIVILAAVLALLIGFPFTMWVLVRVTWPEFGETTSRASKILIVGVVLTIAVASFVLGLNQSHFLTCEDFQISGNAEPAGCVHEPVDTP